MHRRQRKNANARERTRTRWDKCNAFHQMLNVTFDLCWSPITYSILTAMPPSGKRIARNTPSSLSLRTSRVPLQRSTRSAAPLRACLLACFFFSLRLCFFCFLQFLCVCVCLVYSGCYLSSFPSPLLYESFLSLLFCFLFIYISFSSSLSLFPSNLHRIF